MELADKKGIYGLDAPLVDCLKTLKQFKGLDTESIKNELKSKIDYYRRTPKIDTSGYIRDFKEYYLKQKIDNESDDAKIISMLSTISPQDFLHQNFNKYNISAQGLNYLKKLHFNFSKSKSMGHYDRQSELISKGISQTPSDLTPQDIINLDKSLTHFDSITINWAMSFDHCVNPDGSIRIDEAKKCYDFCKENGKKIRALGAIYPTVANRLQAENISSEDLRLHRRVSQYLLHLLR